MSKRAATALAAQEPSAPYLVGKMAQGDATLTRAFDLLATAPGGVAKLRELILSMAVQGQLVEQDPRDAAPHELLAKVRAGTTKPPAERDDSSALTRPYPIADGWTWLSLGDAAVISGGVTLGRKTTPLNPITLPYLRVANVQRWSLSLGTLKDITIDQSELGKYQLKPGDLLVTEGGDWDKVGRTCTWRDELPVCAHQNHVFKVRGATMDWVPAWAELYLNGPVARAYFAGAAKQTTNLASINMRQLKACPFPFPPLAEQHRIVTRVEELMRVCDALEAKGQLADAQHVRLVSTLFDTLTRSQSPQELAEHWQRISAHFDLLLDRPEVIDALEQTILQLAVRGLLVPQDPRDEPASELLARIRAERAKLDARSKPVAAITEGDLLFGVPAHWEAVRFGDYMLEFATGPFGSMVHKEDYVSDGVPLVNPSHMIADRVRADADVSVSPEMAEQLASYRLSAGDIVMARRGEVGRHAVVTKDEDGWLCGTGSFVAKFSPDICRSYISLVLNEGSFRAHLAGESVGATMVNLNQRILLNAPIAVPPLPEQRRIVTRVQQLRALCAQLRERLHTARATQARLAQTLVEQATMA